MKKRAMCIFGLLAITLPSAALADDAPSEDRGPMVGGTIRRHKESPQSWLLEIRFSPYTPQIDDEAALNGKTPYRDTFGTMPRLLFGVELDYQALRIPHLGTLGPGLAVGYTEMTDKSFQLNGMRSLEDTSLDIYPFYAVAVLRADSFYRDYQIPLVPYAKGGIAYALWRGTNPGGTSTYQAAGSTTDVSAKGHTWGTQFAIGASFALNVLDIGSARNLDNGTGINNVYIFGEYYVSALNGIAQSSALHVGANSWAAGLSFEF